MTQVVTPVKDARIKAGLTQEQVAEILNVDPRTVARWDKGSVIPKRKYLLELAMLFGQPALAAAVSLEAYQACVTVFKVCWTKKRTRPTRGLA